MDHDEISWQDVLFEGFEVLVTAPVHGVRGLVVRLAGRVVDVTFSLHEVSVRA